VQLTDEPQMAQNNEALSDDMGDLITKSALHELGGQRTVSQHW